MRNVYLAMESMGALVILILLYANIFEQKRPSEKTKIFTRLLITNGIVVVADLISWLPVAWNKMPWIFSILVGITYIMPFFIYATFSRYIYSHISEKTIVSIKPFHALLSISVILGIVSLGLSLTGKLFSIKDGIWYPGPAENFYYACYLLSILLFIGIIIAYRKKMSGHDLVALLSYCIVPLISLITPILNFEINLSIAFLAIEMIIIYVMIQAESETDLIAKSNVDEMTGLFNRRAYEDDMLYYPDVPPENDFVYASIDINGLKVVNDNLGHLAGDELISGTADCLKITFGNYGRVYRTGGDEFVSMFFANEQSLNGVLKDFAQATDQWRGSLVDELNVSVGIATKREFQTETVLEMSQIAEKRMYEDKAKFYARKGVDRRGQAAAHTALCELYTKIIKINLTTDSYNIVNMDFEEPTDLDQLPATISEWLISFGNSGKVHPDDVDNYKKKTDINYLKEYFNSGKKAMSIYYRRKYDEGFKIVVMELIPANDYSNDNQSLFLYVKNLNECELSFLLKN